MRVKFGAITLGAVIAAAGASQSTAADMFTVNANSVSYGYAFAATDPYETDHTRKGIISFTHFDAWAYGTNLFNIDLLKSNSNDPSNPCGLPGFPATGCEGTTEIYGFFRSTLGWKEDWRATVPLWRRQSGCADRSAGLPTRIGPVRGRPASPRARGAI